MTDEWRSELCSCGSGQQRRPLSDAKGYFVAYVCEECEPNVKKKYRPEIFTDPDYYAPEDEEG